MDLDKFKLVNDSLGHHIGDVLLKDVARRLKASLRSCDMVSRQGGDEFILFITGLSRLAEATMVADKIVAELGRPFYIEFHKLHITPSIGISLYPQDGENETVLIKCADTAMYSAKAAGRNNYKLYTPDMGNASVERLSMENSMREGLARNEFSLRFQPQIDLETGTVVGAESLLRWNSPVHGEVSPAEFIPIAEECGLIHDIGEWVLTAVGQQQRQWSSQGVELVRVAVNISAVQFQQDRFMTSIRALVESKQIDPQLIELELTEGVVMQDVNRSIELLEQLKAMGFTIAIDDFGTGYSSLSYLKRLPLDRLKIDQSFIQDITTDRTDLAIAEAIIVLGKTLNLEVVAEGVEEADQQQLLASQGCDSVQGFQIARPMKADAFVAWQLGFKRRGSRFNGVSKPPNPASLSR